MTLLAFAFVLALVVAGYGLTHMLDIELTVEERLSYGTVLGVVQVTIVGFLLSWWADLTQGTVIATALISLALAAPGYRLAGGAVIAEWEDFGRRLRQPISNRTNPAPFLILMTLGAVVSLRVLGGAYGTGADGGITVGHLSTFGDWSAHLGYAASFAEAQNFPPELPTAAGDSFAYHFGVDFFSALFMPLGLKATTALQVSSGVLAFAFPGVMYCASLRFTGTRTASVIAVLVFLLAGGTGALDHYLFADGGISDPFNLPRTFAFDGFQDQWIDNSITGFLYPQRPTLIGFPVVLMGLAWLWQARDQAQTPTRTYLAVGILLGLMPLFHIFAFGVLLVMAGWFALLELDNKTKAAVLSAVWVGGMVMLADQVGATVAFPLIAAVLVVVAAGLLLPDQEVQIALAVGAAVGVLGLLLTPLPIAVAGLGLVAGLYYAKKHHWFLLFVPSMVIGVPLVIWQLPENSGVQEPNHTWWMLGVATGTDAEGNPTVPYPRNLGGFLDFWWTNTGFFIPLVLLAMVWFIKRESSRSLGLAFLPIWGLLVIPNVAILHFWEGNNVKYVVFFLLLGAPLIGAVLAEAMDRMVWMTPVAVLLVFTLTLSGGLDVLRAASGEVTDEGGVTWPVGYFSAGDVLVGEWVAENTPPDAVFIAAPSHKHPVRSLSGRTVVAGSLGRIRDLGVNWGERNEQTRLVLGGFEGYDAVLAQYDVDFIVMGPDELNPGIGGGNAEFWDGTAPRVYALGGYTVYDVRALTASIDESLASQ